MGNLPTFLAERTKVFRDALASIEDSENFNGRFCDEKSDCYSPTKSHRSQTGKDTISFGAALGNVARASQALVSAAI